jgi:hypothetical protein
VDFKFVRAAGPTRDYDLAILDINLQGSNVQPVTQSNFAAGATLVFPNWLRLEMCAGRISKSRSLSKARAVDNSGAGIRSGSMLSKSRKSNDAQNLANGDFWTTPPL